MWPLKSTNINTFSYKQIETNFFHQISTFDFRLSESFKSYSIFSVSVSSHAFSQGSSLSQQEHWLKGAIQAWFPAVALIVWASVLLTVAFNQLDDCLRSRCFVCHNGDPFILLVFPPESIWLWQTRATHFIIVPNYYLMVGVDNYFIKCPLCWWKPIRFRLIFYEHMPS